MQAEYIVDGTVTWFAEELLTASNSREFSGKV